MLKRTRISGARGVALLVLYVAGCCVAGCDRAPPATGIHAQPPYAGTPEVVVVERHDEAVPSSDAAPRVVLAFRYGNGALRPIEGEALSYTPFRDGVALVDVTRQLVLVSPDGSRRLLARKSGAPPITGMRGELLYVARYGVGAEIHRLEPNGSDRMIADGLSNAGVLTPEADGAVLFVGARNGGVAGIWRVDAQPDAGARCITNCDLKTGTDWGSAYEQPPGSQEALREAYAKHSAVIPSTNDASDKKDALGGEP